MPGTKENEEKEIKEERELPVSKRRLDSLAMMLENGSVCAAIALVNKEIFIATNKLDEKTALEESIVPQFIDTMMTYFKMTAERNPSNASDSSIFTSICEQTVKIPNDLAKSLVDYILTNKNSPPSIFAFGKQNPAILGKYTIGEDHRT